MTQQPHYILTQAGFDRLQEELAEYRARRAEQETERLDVQGDAGEMEPEEGAVFEARAMRDWLDERIGQLEKILRYAEISGEDPDPERVNVGDRVTVRDVREGTDAVFDILDSEEVAFAARDNQDSSVTGVSAESPVGRALLGCRLGDVIDVQVPDGTVRYAVRAMTRIPS